VDRNLSLVPLDRYLHWVAHKLFARGLKKCLAFTDDSPTACTDYIASINTSVSQLGHMKDMSVCDVFALVTLMGLYILTSSGHQKAYKELLAYVDVGNVLTLDDVQHAIILYLRSKSNCVFSVHRSDTHCPTLALAAALVLGTTVLATIAALAAATLVDVCQTPLHAHRVEPAVALVAPLTVPIPILLTRIRRPLPNVSSFDAIVACRRKPVSMPPCFTATTWSPSRFCLTLAARIIKTNTPTSLSLKLQRTSCTWSVTLQTTKTLESILFCLYICRALFFGSVQGHLIWRSIYLEGSSVGGLFLCFFFSLSCLRGWINFLFATRWSNPFI
jgi:hypothetical protein